MLTLKQPIETLELTQLNPCFTAEIDEQRELFAHIYRKGTNKEKRECYIPKKNCCDNDRFPYPEMIECDYTDAWLSSHTSPHTFCIPDTIFNTAPGVWCIDLYREMEVIVECDKIDPTNYLRRLKQKRMAKNLCKSYEFHIGERCNDLTTYVNENTTGYC